MGGGGLGDYGGIEMDGVPGKWEVGEKRWWGEKDGKKENEKAFGKDGVRVIAAEEMGSGREKVVG